MVMLKPQNNLGWRYQHGEGVPKAMLNPSNGILRPLKMVMLMPRIIWVGGTRTEKELIRRC